MLRRLLGVLFKRCAVVKLSEEEIEFVTGTTDVPTALDWLARRGVVVAIVTRGPKGASLRFRGETRQVPARWVKVIDTTGAGDGFTAGFLFGLTRQYSTRAELERADVEALVGHAHFGCLVGSHVVTRLGAVAGLPKRGQI